MTFVSYAQNREDVVLYRALKEVSQGFYIDVGAHDPSIDSVTRAFYERGWRGMNIEPAPFWFARLSATRPHDINLNVAASDVEGEAFFYEVGGTGLSTLKSGVGQHHSHAGIYPVTKSRIATATLMKLCADHAVRDVHFMKIDVEGTEDAVLRGMDFDAVRPWIVLVEAIDPVTHMAAHLKWEPYVLKAGYEFALFDGLNRFYVDSRRPELKDRLSAPANILDDFVVASLNNYSAMSLPAGFGINLFGQFTSATGLGSTVRHTAKAIFQTGIPLTCHDLGAYYPTSDVADELADIAHLFEGDPTRLPHPINLYSLPSIEFPRLSQHIPNLLSSPRFHAAIVWWEATKLHPTWVDALMRQDAVIAYSEFLSEVLANSLLLTPVLTGHQPLFLPSGIRAERHRFQFPEGTTVFLGCFDPASDPARKNPTAMIAAFRHAFDKGEDNVRLVLRLNNANSTQMGHETLRVLMDAASGDGRIGIVVEPMSYRSVLSLYASSDVHISLHRAEGLGLGMLESMRLGIPVIATGWSGNMTFMDHRCACLVRYRLAQASGNHPFYRQEVLGSEAKWAEPVLEDAVAWMRHLHRFPAARRHIGELGRLRAERYQQEACRTDWLLQLAQIWSNSRLLPHVTEKFSTAGRVA